ncbi:MAG TPA: sigma-70 family RNA polymerase sigma factor, partial [Opitutaceae bacterium]|nr:sigma-70 family RNA polymerase sigma factor [Opitutaceae bacterium]
MAAHALNHSIAAEQSPVCLDPHHSPDSLSRERAPTARSQFDVYLSQAKLTPLLTHDSLIRLAREVYVNRYSMLRVFSQYLPCVASLAEQFQHHEDYGLKLSGFATGIVDQSVESRDATLALNRTHGKGQPDGEVQDEAVVREHCEILVALLEMQAACTDASQARYLRTQLADSYLKFALRVDEFERHASIFETHTQTLRDFCGRVCEITGSDCYPAELDTLSPRLVSRLAHTLPADQQGDFHDLGLEVCSILRHAGLTFSAVLELRDCYDRHKIERNRHINMIVQSNLLLAARETLKQKPDDDRLFDLCQEANFGLMIAADRFAYWRDLAFSTYAVFWIRQRLIRDRDHNSNPAFSIPCSVAARVKKVIQARNRLALESDEPVTSARIAAEIGSTRELVDEALQAHIVPADVTAELPIEVPDSEDVYNEASNIALRETLVEALKLIPERKRKIFDMRWGITCDERHTLFEVSALFGITKEGIRRVEKDVVNQLRSGPYGRC